MRVSGRTAALLCLAAPAFARAAPSPATSLPAAFTDSGGLYVRASVDGAAERWFAVDTGTTPSVIDLGYARSLGLPLDGRRGRGLGAGPDRPSYVSGRLTDLRIGTRHFHQVLVQAFPFAPPGPDGQPIAGVLGSSLLGGRVWTIDYPAHRLLVDDESLADCAVCQPFDFRSGIPVVTVRLNGRATDAIIDTGGVYTLLVQPNAATRLGLASAMAAATPDTGWGYGGRAEFRSGAGPDLEVGPVRRAAVRTMFLAIPVPIDAAIGTEFLHGVRMTIDYPARRVRFAEPFP